MKDIVEVRHASHKTKDCAVYINYFHSMLFLLSYKKSIYVLSQFLLNFECFVCEYLGTD